MLAMRRDVSMPSGRHETNHVPLRNVSLTEGGDGDYLTLE